MLSSTKITATTSSPLYTPLDPAGGFRILVLRSGPESSAIECELISQNLNHDRQYQALSCDWGQAENSKTIKLNGVAVSVRLNLWWALWHLRKTGMGERRIWIDALCINQDDEKERGHQVALMGRIFRDAEVICWLGRADGDNMAGCDRAMKYVESVSELCGRRGHLWLNKAGDILGEGIPISKGFGEGLIQEEPSCRRLFDILGESTVKAKTTQDILTSRKEKQGGMTKEFTEAMMEEKIWISHNFDPRDFKRGAPIPLLRTSKSSIAHHDQGYYSSQDNLYYDMETLYMHSYWQRTWIIQEVVLGKSIVLMLGDRCVDGGAFYLVAKSILMRSIKEESLLVLGAFRVFSLRVGRLMKRGMELMRLMEISEQSSSEDVRDKVYTMIGLACDCQNGRLIPDYAKSIEEIYRDVIFSNSSPPDVRCWSVVHGSALIQRAFWPLCGSVQSLQDEDATAKNGPIFFLAGLYIGTVSSMVDPEANDMMWWAHPGLVKPIASEPYLSAPQEKPFVLFSSFSFFVNHLSTLSSLVPRLSFSLFGTQKPLNRNLIKRISVHPSSETPAAIYGPAEIQEGDLMVRFMNSHITAVLRRVSNGYILVGRAMVLNKDGDLDILFEGRRTLTPQLLKRGTKVEFWLKEEDLKSLTSPHY